MLSLICKINCLNHKILKTEIRNLFFNLYFIFHLYTDKTNISGFSTKINATKKITRTNNILRPIYINICNYYYL